MSDEQADLTTGTIYEQVNENWRFLAKWRQVAFAGHLAVLAGAVSFINFAIEHSYPRWAIGGCLLLFAMFGVIFWIADRRTHRLTMHACKAGAKLEGTQEGFFRVNASLDADEGVHHDGFWRFWTDPHSRAALLLFLGSTAVFIAAAVSLWTGVLTLKRDLAAGWEYSIVRGPVTTGITSPDSLGAELGRAAAERWEFVAVGRDPSSGSFVILRRHKR